MSSFAVCLNAVLPLFLVMGLGYIARCTGAISRTDVPKANKWAFKFFMPIMLFYNIYTSDLSAAAQPKIIIFAVVCVLVLYGLSFGFVMLAEKQDDKRGVADRELLVELHLGAQFVRGIVDGAVRKADLETLGAELDETVKSNAGVIGLDDFGTHGPTAILGELSGSRQEPESEATECQNRNQQRASHYL